MSEQRCMHLVRGGGRCSRGANWAITYYRYEGFKNYFCTFHKNRNKLLTRDKSGTTAERVPTVARTGLQGVRSGHSQNRRLARVKGS